MWDPQSAIGRTLRRACEPNLRSFGAGSAVLGTTPDDLTWEFSERVNDSITNNEKEVPMSTFGLRYAKFGILTLLLVLGCSGAPTGKDSRADPPGSGQTAQNAPPTAEPTATVASALSGPLQTFWVNTSSGDGSHDQTTMLSADFYYCWLITISGGIRDTPSNAGVWLSQDTGIWILNAQSDGTSTTVGAAACISWNDFNQGEAGMMVENNWTNTIQNFATPQPNPVCSISGIYGDWRTESRIWAYGGGFSGTPGYERTSDTNAWVDVNCTSRRTPSTAITGSCFRQTCGQISDNNHICMIRYVAQYSSNPVYAQLFQGSDGSWGAVTGLDTAILYFCVQL